jgi:glutamine synthetase type III
MRILSLLSAIAVVAACSDDIVGANGVPSRSMSLKVGETLELTLQSIDPGEYASPPAISSALLRFLDVSLVTPAVPAGVTQKFRFSGQAAGRAVITFEQTGQSSDPGAGLTIQDTVEVH